MGDLLEAFWLDDPRYDIETTKDPPLKQKNQMKDKLSCIQSKIDTMLMGNHCRKLLNKVGNIMEDLCNDLKIQYGTYTAKIEFSDGYKFYITHGSRPINSISPDPIRRQAYMEFILKRHLEDKAGDCVVMAKGHAHKLLVSSPLPQLYLTTKKGKIRKNYTKPGSGKDPFIPPENRYYCCTGSFLRSQMVGVSTYSEMAEYAPIEIGYILIEIRDKKVANVKKVVV
jgi:hypothetical protein